MDSATINDDDQTANNAASCQAIATAHSADKLAKCVILPKKTRP